MILKITFYLAATLSALSAALCAYKDVKSLTIFFAITGLIYSYVALTYKTNNKS